MADTPKQVEFSFGDDWLLRRTAEQRRFRRRWRTFKVVSRAANLSDAVYRIVHLYSTWSSLLRCRQV